MSANSRSASCLQTVPFPLLQQGLCGCAECVETDGALTLRRITGALAELYNQQEGSRIRAACASGIRMRFKSETRRLRIALRFGEVPWPEDRRYLCDISIDGKLRPFGPTCAQGTLDWEGEIVFRQRRMRIVELWFCHVARVDLLHVKIEQGSTFTTVAPPERRWLAYGDSITQGMQSTRPARNYPNRLAREFNLNLLNVAIGGATLAPELAACVPAGRFDLVSIAYGTNDCAKQVPPEEFLSNTKALIGALRRLNPRTPVILIAPPQRLDVPMQPQFSLGDYRQGLAELSNEMMNVRCADATSFLPPKSEYYHDNIHPNDAGFACYAHGLRPDFQAILH